MSDDDAVDIDIEAPTDESVTTGTDNATRAASNGATSNGSATSTTEPDEVSDSDANTAPDTEGESDTTTAPDAEGESDATTAPDAEGESDTVTEPTLADRVAEYDAEIAADIEDLEARVEQLETELEEKSNEIQDLTSRLKRKQADFQNYKQRQKKKQQRMKERAAEDVIEGMVSVRDNLMRALDQDAETDIRPGVESTLEEFDRVLAEEGVDPIEPEPGEDVDPTRHQVMMRVESEEPSGTVDELFQPGYEIGDKVIREAQVTVSQSEE